MPLNIRTISINLAVISFFGLSLISSLNGLSAYICCKRAIIGAVLVYFVCSLTVKIINIILIDALVTDRLNQQNSQSEAGTKKPDRKG